MADNSAIEFSSVQADITTNNVTAHASELHGVLTGLIAGGLDFESTDFLPMLNDLFNNGEGLPLSVKQAIKAMYSDIWQQMLDDAYGFQLLLPDDDDSLQERAHAISVWVQGFNLGFGLQQKNSTKLPKEVQEVLTDFAEIANLSDDIDEDEASEQAFYEVVEYVRVSALICFTELGQPPKASADEETIH